MGRVRVRPLERRDMKDLVANNLDYAKEAKDPNFYVSSPAVPLNKKEEQEYFRSLWMQVERGDAIVSVAEAKGIVRDHVVGKCEIKRTNVFEMPHVGGLSIEINKEFRGWGIGTALLEDAIERSKEKFKIIMLAVFGPNPARKLYKRLGFEEVGVIPNGVKKDGEYMDYVFMARELRK
ncbi:MAG: GNAT family N-acetyltransferase [Candidatus Micrarchaeota archaeon]|nr:GNAT family N-acetyltransferase [Candidatus Micrarchaeota archaeon]MDE1847447.1 GNAT family N-acetyltransferase [Candidatus Micrarchaeota archaeon]MDE1864058.1 GNAT family N-acetyltransferase [Candidatus Micrarchaeota archaeon]